VKNFLLEKLTSGEIPVPHQLRKGRIHLQLEERARRGIRGHQAKALRGDALH
jgi:hypothetical protein